MVSAMGLNFQVMGQSSQADRFLSLEHPRSSETGVPSGLLSKQIYFLISQSHSTNTPNDSVLSDGKNTSPAFLSLPQNISLPFSGGLGRSDPHHKNRKRTEISHITFDIQLL